MRQLTIFFITFITCNMFSHAQISFQKTYGGNGYNYGKYIQQTSDTGYIIVGNTDTYGSGDNDILLIKINSSGGILWSRTFGALSGETANNVQQTGDKGFIIGGTTNSYGAGNTDIYVIKTDSSGQLQWTKTYGGSWIDDYGVVCQTSDKRFVVFGNCYVSSVGFEMFLANVDSVGNIQWSKSLGLVDEDDGYNIIETKDKGYVLIGFKNNFTDGWRAVYFLKTDALGNMLFSKILNVSDSSSEDGIDIIQTKDNGFVILGTTKKIGGISGYDFLLIKTDSFGNINWAKTIGGPNDDFARDVALTSDNGSIIIGTTNSYGFGSRDVLIIKVDSMGNLNWSKTYGGAGWDEGYSIQPAFDLGYIAVGSGQLGSGVVNFYVIKTDSSGNSGCNQLSVVPDVKNVNVSVYSGVNIQTWGMVNNAGSLVTNPSIVEDTLCFTINISERNVLQPLLAIYPNPVSESATINFVNGNITNWNLYILDINQKVLLSEFVHKSDKYFIGKEKLSSGMYFYKIVGCDNTFYVGKIVIE